MERLQCFLGELGLTCLPEEGTSLYDDDGVQHHTAVARGVLGVSRGGDTVVANLAVLVGVGMSQTNVAPFANKAADIVVGKFGTASVAQEELFGGGAGLAELPLGLGPVAR